MNPAASLSTAFMRRLARTPLRRRNDFAARQLSSSAPVLHQQKIKHQKSFPPAPEPYSATALASLLARLSLPSTPALQEKLLACLTHPSYTASETGEPEAAGQDNNELLAPLGNSLLGLFASEEVATRYPHLPSRALSKVVTAYVGPEALLSVGRQLGISVQNTSSNTKTSINSPQATPIRWKRPAYRREDVETPVAPGFQQTDGRVTPQEAAVQRRRESWQDGVASVVRAFVGLVYQEQGLTAAREFVQAHFMSRHVDITNVFNFVKPKFLLSNVVSKHLADAGVPVTPESSRIESRVLASSGTNTQAPLFNVGLFLSNGLKLAEGHGSSLVMAEHRAAVNALHSLFLVQDTSNRVLPTALHSNRPIVNGSNIHNRGAAEAQYVPNPAAMGASESLHGLGDASH